MSAYATAYAAARDAAHAAACIAARATLAGWWCPSCGHGNTTRGQRSGCAGCDWRPLRGERSPAMVDLRRTTCPPR